MKQQAQRKIGYFDFNPSDRRNIRQRKKIKGNRVAEEKRLVCLTISGMRFKILQGRELIPFLSDQGSLGLIYSKMVKQASMFSFNDAIYLILTTMMLTPSLILLMEKWKPTPPLL